MTRMLTIITPAGILIEDVNSAKWVEMVRAEMKRWEEDANYIPVLPFGVQIQQVAVEAKA